MGRLKVKVGPSLLVLLLVLAGFLALMLSPLSTAAASGDTGQLRGIVKLQGRSNYQGANVTLVPTQGEPIQTTAGSDGSFSLVVPSGTYQVKASMAPGYLSAQRESVTVKAGEATILPEVMLLAGDADSSGSVNALDLALLGSEFGSPAADTEPADINADGLVDIYDLVLVGLNFGKSESLWTGEVSYEPLPTGYVLSVYPSDGTTDVPLDSQIVITFSQEVDRDSFEACFESYPAIFPSWPAQWSSPTVTITPAFRLAPNTTYTVYLRGDILRNAQGIPVGEDYIWQFTTGPSQPHPGEQIAFVRRAAPDAPANLWLMNPDGTNQRQLTALPAAAILGKAIYNVETPAFSPDGTRIAFTSNLGSEFSLIDYNIFVVNEDGGMVRLVTGDADPGQRPGATGTIQGQVQFPDYSDLGSHISPGSFRVYAKGTGHSAPVDETTGAFILAGVPEGEGWVKVRGGYTAGVGVVQGSQQTFVVADQVFQASPELSARMFKAMHPSWSGDGTRLAYTFNLVTPELYQGAVVPSEKPAIAIINADGTDSRLVFPTGEEGAYYQAACPAWSPVADRLAYAITVDLTDPAWQPGRGIWVSDAEGGNRSQLTSLPMDPYAQGIYWDLYPVWSPDGTRIAFNRYVIYWSMFGLPTSGSSDIYVMNADGSGLTCLTSSGVNEYAEHPSWSPDGSRIVYHVGLGGDPWTFEHESYDIWVMNADGSGKVQLTDDGSSAFPSWGSPQE